MDPLRNPKDPLHMTGPEAEKELFRRLGSVCNEFPRETVICAAMNLLINAIRQNEAGRNGAMAAFDEVSGRARHILLEKHYDSLGKRRNVFPFAQIIDIPHYDARRKAS